MVSIAKYPGELKNLRNHTDNKKVWGSMGFVLLSLSLGVIFWNFRQPISAGLSSLSDREMVISHMEGYGIWGPVLICLLIALQVLISLLPGRMLMIASGYIYGPVVGSIITVLPTIVASMMAFYIARSGLRPLVERLVPRQVLAKWQKIADKQGFSFYCIVFLLPVFPADALCYVAGMSTISPRRFLAASFVGRIPLTILMPIIGAYGLDLSTQAWASIITLNLLLVGIGKVVAGKFKASTTNA